MKLRLHKYKNIEEYKDIQKNANIKKLNLVWVKEDVIIEISNYINAHIKNVSFGICHGTRRGVEHQFFKKHLINKVNVIGTEISSTATQFPDTIEWDFHNIKDEWINNVDFIDCFSGNENTYRTLLNEVGTVVDEFKVYCEETNIKIYTIFVIRKK